MPRRKSTTSSGEIKPIRPGQQYCSAIQAAAVLGVTPPMVYRAFHNGEIRGARTLGDRILIPVSWVIPPSPQEPPDQ